MAGSVLGGLDSIYGAIIGVVAVAVSQKWLTLILMQILGTWVGSYEGLVPIIFLFFILIIEPQGLTNLKPGQLNPVRGARSILRRLKSDVMDLKEGLRTYLRVHGEGRDGP